MAMMKTVTEWWNRDKKPVAPNVDPKNPKVQDANPMNALTLAEKLKKRKAGQQQVLDQMGK